MDASHLKVSETRAAKVIHDGKRWIMTSRIWAWIWWCACRYLGWLTGSSMKHEAMYLHVKEHSRKMRVTGVLRSYSLCVTLHNSLTSIGHDEFPSSGIHKRPIPSARPPQPFSRSSVG